MDTDDRYQGLRSKMISMPAPPASPHHRHTASISLCEFCGPASPSYASTSLRSVQFEGDRFGSPEDPGDGERKRNAGNEVKASRCF